MKVLHVIVNTLYTVFLKGNKTSYENETNKAFRFSAFLIVVMGFLLLFTGMGLRSIGNTGKARYNQASGKFIRIFSGGDQKNYKQLDLALTLGSTLNTGGVLVVIAGRLFLYNSYWLFLIYSQARRPFLLLALEKPKEEEE